MPPVTESRNPIFAPLAPKPFQLTPEGVAETRKPLDAMVERNTSHLFSLQTQLGVYLVLGNGIAIFTLSQAVIQGQIASNVWTDAMYLRFMWGLAVAFVAMAATYFFGLFGSYVLGLQSQYLLIIADADKQASTATDPGTKRTAQTARQITSELLEKHNRYVPQMIAWMVLVIGIYIASGALFIWGLAGGLHLQP